MLVETLGMLHTAGFRSQGCLVSACLLPNLGMLCVRWTVRLFFSVLTAGLLDACFWSVVGRWWLVWLVVQCWL